MVSAGHGATPNRQQTWTRKRQRPIHRKEGETGNADGLWFGNESGDLPGGRGDRGKPAEWARRRRAGGEDGGNEGHRVKKGVGGSHHVERPPRDQARLGAPPRS